MSRATHLRSHPRRRHGPTVGGMALHLMFNPGRDALIYDEAGHQADPGHFQADTDDPITSDLITRERLLDQGPVPKKGH